MVNGTVLIYMRIQSKVVPNMMIGMHYNNRDVSPFYPFDVFVMDETCMYNCPTFLFWKCLDDNVVLDKSYRAAADNKLYFSQLKT